MATNAVTPPNFYKPSELLGIFKNFFSNKEINAQVVTLHGVYFKSNKIYGSVAYDQIRDENTTDSFTIVIPVSLRETLQNGNLISVQGILDRRAQNNGSIQFLLNVSRVDVIKDIAISEDEIKRAEFRRVKEQRGYKNVDSLLEDKLFRDLRPLIALIYAGTSITNADFEKGLQAAKTAIDFRELRQSFANPTEFCNLLAQIDRQSYDCIVIIRGGGSGIEKLDEPSLVKMLAELNTPWIYGVGHEQEKLFIRNIADKVIPIPFAVGTYFRDLVEAVKEKRTKSRAALVEDVRKQFIKQIEDANKKNAELNKQLEAMQKAHREQTEASNKRIAELTKAQQEAQRQAKAQLEAFDKAQKEQKEAADLRNKELQTQLETQGKTLASFQEQQRRQQEQFNRTITDLQQGNARLQETVNRVNQENRDLQNQLVNAQNQSNTGYIVAIIALIIIAIIGFCI